MLLDPGAPSVAQDLEPEYVAVSGDVAYVTLQEANALAVIDLDANTLRGVYPFGLKDHSLPGNGFDASDRDGAGNAGRINIQTWPVFGAYQPDAVAAFEQDGTAYVVTANEGDARTDARLATRTLDPARFPNAAELLLPANLGRLNTIPYVGDDDGDGDVDRIVAVRAGARSRSSRSDRPPPTAAAASRSSSTRATTSSSARPRSTPAASTRATPTTRWTTARTTKDPSPRRSRSAPSTAGATRSSGSSASAA